MDSNDATILALALGIPSATLLSIAFLLALRIQHRQLQAQRTPNPTVPTNTPAPSPPPVDPYYGILLEQRPPRILAPLPHRPIPLDDFARVARQEEVRVPEPIPIENSEGGSSAPPRRCEPIIILSPSTTTTESPAVPRSPTPGEYGHYRNNGRGFDVGRDIRVTAPPPTTVLGMPILQHPQPQSVPVSSGITSQSSSVPTSLTPAMARLSTEPLPRHRSISSIEELRQSGTSPYKTMIGSHLSLYERSPSRVDQPSLNPTTAAIGHTSSSRAHHHKGLEYTEGEENESPDSSDQSHNLHQSYSRPPSRDTMSTSLTRPLERAPSRSATDQPHHSQTRRPSPMEEQIPS